jgi:phosphatidylinositol glycan class B
MPKTMGLSQNALTSPGIAEVSSNTHWMVVFGVLLAFRIVNALTIKTFFQPDEYFQALEPAWKIAFGADSGAWITWVGANSISNSLLILTVSQEWLEGLRTAVHPWIFAIVYKVADVMSTLEGASRAARAEDMILAPKIAQAIFAALLDFYTWKLSQKVYGAGSSASMATLALTVLSPWQWHTSTRTFANSFETTLTVIALNLWPWGWFIDAPANSGLQMNVLDDGPSLELKDFLDGKEVKTESRPSSSSSSQTATSDSSQKTSSDANPVRLNAALAAAALACILRPTNGIIWMTIACTTMVSYSNYTRSATLVRSALVVG